MTVEEGSAAVEPAGSPDHRPAGSAVEPAPSPAGAAGNRARRPVGSVARGPGGAPRPVGVLVDMDGVLRHWDPQREADAERRHGLRPGSIAEAYLHPDLFVPAVLGRVSHAEWMESVAGVLAGQLGGDLVAARAAVADWGSYRGEVDPRVLALVRRARSAGRRVGLATNATDKLDDDLATLGLAGEFDAVLNSSRMGAVKPQPEFYRLACAALDLSPAEVILVDDSVRFVAGARASGLYAHRYLGAGDLGYLDSALGL